MERDEFIFRLNKLMDEKNLHVQLSMLMSILDCLDKSYGGLLPFEETASFLGHSFRESFNAISTNKSRLFMKLMLKSADREFIGEVIFLLMAIGKVQTLKWLYNKIPDIFRDTNLERLLGEILYEEGKFRYWEHNLIFWEVGKYLK